MFTWQEMFPEGRWIFYEGSDPEGFAHEMIILYEFDPRYNPSEGYNSGWTPSRGYYFHCPGRCINEVYGSGKYPLGS